MPTARTRTRLLDATMTVLARTGLARLSLEDVAAEAGVSRQTLYRYFGSRNALITATILREEEAFIARMVAAAAPHRDLRSALEAAIASALTVARAHPLLDRLLASEPEALLPFLTLGEGPVLSAARPVVEGLLAERLPDASGPELARVAEAATRLIVSYAISPPADPVEDVAAGLADLIAVGIAPR